MMSEYSALALWLASWSHRDQPICMYILTYVTDTIMQLQYNLCEGEYRRHMAGSQWGRSCLL